LLDEVTFMEKRRLIIVGSGPAGYSAATYAARAQLNPLVLAGEKSGGQLMLTTMVENYTGFKEGIMGPELMMQMRAQAERFGADMVDKFVTRVDLSDRPFRVYVGEDEYQADAVILATGAEARMLGIPGEDKYLGRGVAACAVCDAAFYKEKRTIVVGGGDAAMEDALALTKFASSVTVIVRRGAMKASKIMQQRVLEEHKDKVSVMWNSEALEVLGDETRVTGVRVKDNKTGEEKVVETDGFFLAIGHKPVTGFLDDQVRLDEQGYVLTRFGLAKSSLNMAGEHVDEKGLVQYPTMTSVGGVFAAGDNVDFRYRQAITAAGYGTMAALDAEWWLERE
jgi:thioredoxin reductase (NADPH)